MASISSSGNVTASAAEAAYVMGKCPSSIVGIEIGNEPDKFKGAGPPNNEVRIVRDRHPRHAGRFVGWPGLHRSRLTVSFTVPFADILDGEMGQQVRPSDAALLRCRSRSSGCSAPNLQITTPDSPHLFDDARLQPRDNGLPDGWRMGENNTCSGHGQQGVSDTLISGLWAIDIHVQVAKRGGSGINFHNGETGMDGTVPFYYEPIKETMASWCRSAGILRHAPLHPSRHRLDGLHDRHHERPVFHRVGHQGERIHQRGAQQQERLEWRQRHGGSRIRGE